VPYTRAGDMAAIPEQGTRVQVNLRTWSGEIEHIGVIIPPASPGYLSLKLVNGYNVSHPVNAILSLTTLQPTDSSPSENTDSEGILNAEQNNLPLVRIIHTGGTIASKVDYATGAVVASFEPEELISAIPELAEIARIEAVKIGNMWSDDMRPQHWNSLLSASAQAFAEGAVGVVVTSGTDTLAITAAALAFGWAGEGGSPPGRIAVTGSQRSSDRGSSDAGENLIAAVHWAANGPAINGGLGDSTVVVMHANSNDGEIAILPGCSTRKLHSTRRDAFKPINAEPLAIVNINRGKPSHTLSPAYEEVLASTAPRQSTSPTMYDCKIKIAQLNGGPHLLPDIVSAVANNGYSALVFHGTGLGHLPIENPNGDAPENDKLAETISQVIAEGLHVIMANLCINGPVNMNVYSKGRNQQNMGILGQGSNSSPDTIVVKTHWSLSQGRNLAEDLQSNLLGENPTQIRS